MAGAVVGTLPFSAVDERDIVPNLVVHDAVLELRMRPTDELVRFADFKGCSTTVTGAAEGFRVLCACRNMDRCGPVGLVDAPEPDIVGTAIADDCTTGCRKTCLQGHDSKDNCG